MRTVRIILCLLLVSALLCGMTACTFVFNFNESEESGTASAESAEVSTVSGEESSKGENTSGESGSASDAGPAE
ncbi:MAG: hypothetical protein ILO68_04770, partial [Clostridia bacterium]|nr:hypothetical protein [Clostridia bacterium]